MFFHAKHKMFFWCLKILSLNNDKVKTFLLFLLFNFIYAQEEKEGKTFLSQTGIHVFVYKQHFAILLYPWRQSKKGRIKVNFAENAQFYTLIKLNSVNFDNIVLYYLSLIKHLLLPFLQKFLFFFRRMISNKFVEVKMNYGWYLAHMIFILLFFILWTYSDLLEQLSSYIFGIKKL